MKAPFVTQIASLTCGQVHHYLLTQFKFKKMGYGGQMYCFPGKKIRQ